MKPVRFNPQLRLRGCEDWVELILAQLLKSEQRLRARQPQAMADYKHCLEVLLANLIQLNYVSADSPLFVRLGKNSKGYDRCFGAAHRQIIRSMVYLGWLSISANHRRFEAGRYYTLSCVSLALMPFGHTSLQNIRTMPRTKIVQLKSFKDLDGKATVLPLPNTARAIEVCQQMQEVNGYLNSITVDYSGVANKFWLEESDEWPTATIRNILDNSMMRSFNGDLHHGGRLYHGWWLNLKKRVRFDSITINGEQIAYVDFKELNLRLAYADAGAEYPEHNTYTAGHIGTRDDWKTLTLAMLQASSPLKRYVGDNAKQRQLATALGSSAVRACKMVEAKHPALAGLWYKSRSSVYTCTESDIMVRVLLKAVHLGLHVLPIYDCCICPDSEATQVAELMHSEASAVRLHLPAEITRKQ